MEGQQKGDRNKEIRRQTKERKANIKKKNQGNNKERKGGDKQIGKTGMQQGNGV